MKVWIDLSNSPHVTFFRPVIDRLQSKGADVILTYRDFAETAGLVRASGLEAQCIGGHGGKSRYAKALNLMNRTRALAAFARGKGISVAVSHNSYFQIIAARMSGIPALTLMDYEGTPANHIAFRLANRVLVPASFPTSALRKFGAADAVVYDGIKEDICLADFQPDLLFRSRLFAQMNRTDTGAALVVLRTPPTQALYHRHANPLFPRLLERLAAMPQHAVVVLPRYHEQRQEISASFPQFYMPEAPLPGLDLVHAADLVVSGGGSMNREAAALGTPAATIFAGVLPAVDQHLCARGLMHQLQTPDDVDALLIQRKIGRDFRRNLKPISTLLDEIEKVATGA